MNRHLQNSEGLAAKHLPANSNFFRQIKAAGMAELVDARDLKFPAPAAIAQHSCKTLNSGPAILGADPAHLQNSQRWKLMTEYTETRGMLRKVRAEHGADSEIGHLCSDIMEASENFEKSTDEEQRRHLTTSIVRWMADLDAKLKRK